MLLSELSEISLAANQAFSTSEAPHPAAAVAREILNRQDPRATNRHISPQDIAALTHEIHLQAARERARSMGDYMGALDDDSIDRMRAQVMEALKRLAFDKDGHKISAQEWEKKIFHVYGTVFTGHPTFSMNPQASEVLANLALRHSKGLSEDPELLDQLEQAQRKGHKAPTLEEESDQSMVALRNAHAAARVIEECALQAGQSLYPEEWKKIRYMPASVATWIMFDDDGRTDIPWNKKLAERIKLQRLMLQEHQKDLQHLNDLLPSEKRAPIDALLEKIKATLKITKKHEDFLRSYDSAADTDKNKAAEFSRAMIGSKAERITHPQELIDPLQTLLAQDLKEEAQKEIVLLISRLANHGLSYAQTHYRINSKSVLSALHQNIKFDRGFSGEPLDNTVLPVLVPQLEKAHGLGVNLETLIDSRQTIATQMALARIVTDNYDSHSPIRYLIAETHAAAVPLGALYFAKMFGVDRHINISPLFEDRQGMNEAERIWNVLMNSPHYCAHLAAPRPQHLHPLNKACVQLGYSDSGRFDGQIAAGSWLERVQGKILLSLIAKKWPDVCLSLFHTHGESIGRGRHPAGLKAALHYIASPRILLKGGSVLRTEESFQGGDGFLMHSSPEFSFACGAQAFIYLLKDHFKARADVIYQKGGEQAIALSFYERLRQAHEKLSTDPDYARLIAFFASLMPATGSRPVQRDKASGGARKLPRAIPHNGILMQIGYMANIIYGLGEAIRGDRSGFDRLMKGSPMHALRMELAQFALAKSDPFILREYARLYDPAFWLEKAHLSGDPARRDACHALAAQMQELDIYPSFSRVLQKLIPDYLYVRDALAPYAKPERLRGTFNMNVAHGIRLAQMQDLFLRVQEIPAFSDDRHSITHADLVRGLLSLQPSAFEALEKIFPAAAAALGPRPDFGAPRDHNGFEVDYTSLAQGVKVPIADTRVVIMNISHAMIHANGAVG